MKFPLAACGFLVLSLAVGCGSSTALQLSVEPGRQVILEDKSTISVSLDGVVDEKADVQQTLTWQLTFGSRAQRTQELIVECQKVEVSGKAKGNAYDGERLQSALEQLKLNLTVDLKGRTLSFSETDLSRQSLALAQAAAGATSTMRSLGPLGIVFPSEPIQPGLEWELETDILQGAGVLAETDAEGTGSARYQFRVAEVGRKNGRDAVRIAVKVSGSIEALLQVKNVPTKITGTLEGTGDAWVDRRSGLPLVHTYEGKTSVDAGTGKLTQTQKGSITLKSSPE